MSVLFSKVSLTADNGSTDEFLCSGIPSCEDDLEGWAVYDDFIEDNPDAQDIRAIVESYLRGEGETQAASEDEIADFTQRGEDFLTCEDVQLTQKSDFIILLDQEEDMEMEM